ncbi:MAG: DMT family transporter [Firmicutes bacterium]|nr:DMT family transporter [Bacillota bacterium]
MVSRLILPILVAMVIGSCLAIQPIFNTAVSRSVGMWYAALGSLSVSITILICICFINDRFQTIRSGIGEVPKLYILAGICGIIILAFTIYCMKHIGPVLTASITVTMQMIVATVTAHYGWFGLQQEPINWLKILGIVFLVAGVILVKLSIAK